MTVEASHFVSTNQQDFIEPAVNLAFSAILRQAKSRFTSPPSKRIANFENHGVLIVSQPVVAGLAGFAAVDRADGFVVFGEHYHTRQKT
jgi:hypothetical protein